MTADPVQGPEGCSDATYDQESLEVFLKYTSPGKRQASLGGRPYQVDVELTNQCHAGCQYCLASSEGSKRTHLETGRMLRFLEEMAEMGLPCSASMSESRSINPKPSNRANSWPR